jgi:hypothetical protein
MVRCYLSIIGLALLGILWALFQRRNECSALGLPSGSTELLAQPLSPPVTFREVGLDSGIEIRGRGRGSAWADIDRDGRPDFGIGFHEGEFQPPTTLGSGNPVGDSPWRQRMWTETPIWICL